MRNKYRGPVNRRERDNWPHNVIYEDWFQSQNDAYYIQIYEQSTDAYKVCIRINTYDFQSYGKLYFLRPSGWVEYLTVDANLLKSMHIGPIHSPELFYKNEVLETFRSDAKEILNILKNKEIR